MTMQNEVAAMPRKRPEIIRILIFAGITLALGIVGSLAGRVWSNLLFEMLVYNANNMVAYNIMHFVVSSLHLYGLHIISGVLTRRLVFRSKKSAFPPILVTCGMEDVVRIIMYIVGIVLVVLVNQGHMTAQLYVNCYNAVSFLFSTIVTVLSYVIMRCGFYKKTLDTLVKPAKASAPAEIAFGEEQPEQE